MINTIVFNPENMVISQGIYTKKNPRIKKQIVVQYPDKTMLNGEIVDTVKLGHFIAAELKKEKMKGKDLVFSIDNQDVSIIDISFPYVKGRLQQAAKIAVSEKFIGVTENNYISFKVARVEGNMCYGIAVITPKKILNTYYDLSLQIGMRLKKVDFTPNVLLKNLLLYNNKMKNNEANEKTKTFVIVNTTGPELSAYLYRDGLPYMLRNESGHSLFQVEEEEKPIFVFDRQLKITEDDIKSINDMYAKFTSSFEDLEVLHSAGLVFLKRSLRAAKDEDHLDESTMELMENIRGQLINLKNTCGFALDFDTRTETDIQSFFDLLLIQLQRVEITIGKITLLEEGFVSEFNLILDKLKSDCQNIIEILDRYIPSEEDDKKRYRQQLIERICRVSDNLVMLSDMSGEYPNIETIYIYGEDLTVNEKKLVQQNVGKNYDIQVVNYKTYSQNYDDYVHLGVFYDEYSFFNDLDLSITLEKNDKVNRSNYDNVLVGFGYVSVATVVLLTAFGVYMVINTMLMQKNIRENDQFIKDNSNISEIVNKHNNLTNTIDEIKNYENYFKLSNVDAKALYDRLKQLNVLIDFENFRIEENFKVTMTAYASSMQDFSDLMETMSVMGYAGISYQNVTITDDKGYKTEISFFYNPKIMNIGKDEKQ